ncbi:MAG TPA: ABC transporter permease [Bryobacteraceae bacterium]|nr:ABC transporter permease [Bryobacteraceae bacterium]
MRWWKKPKSPELDHEVRFHIDALTEEKIEQGMTREQARREAVIEFGGTEQIKEELRDVHRLPLIDALVTRTRYAWRVLCGSPSFSLTVIATLALGIGANTAVFSAIDAVLLRPLPYPHPDRLVLLHEYRAKQGRPETFLAPSRLEDWNRWNSSFQAISGYYTEDTVDASGPLPVKMKRAFVAPRFLQTLGVSPALGHDFTNQDEHFASGAGNVLISDRYWREHFHADPDAIGKRLLPDRNSPTVIGVMPPGFAFPEEVDQWAMSAPDAPFAQDRRSTWFTGIGRMKRGVTLAQARADLDLVQQRLAGQFPATDSNVASEVQALKETTVGTARASLWLLFGAVSVLLLMACINVASLLLARGMERSHEFSLRFSLGASRRTILAQLLTETLLLALAGASAGLAIAAVSARLLATMAKSIPRIAEVGMDWRLFLYTAISALVVTLVSGLFPAIRASATALAGSMSRGARSQVSSVRPAQSLLVCVQIALAVCLLSGAGLLLRSFQALSDVSPGFDASHVLAFRLTGGYGETADLPGLRNKINRTLEELRALPGVEAASASLTLPGVPFEYPVGLTSADSSFDPARRITAEGRYVSQGYFASMRIPMLSGTACDQHSDTKGAVVNRSFVSTYFPDRPVLGHHLAGTPNPFGLEPSTILGVAADARETGLDREPVPTVYWCGPPVDPGRYYLVRAAGVPASIASAVRERIHVAEPARAVYDLAPLREHLNESFAEVRLRTVLLGLFAATALSLACVGLYGTMTYLVTTRRREIGLRMALGARRNEVGMRFAGRGLAVTAIGVVTGLLLAAWAVRFISGMLYGVRSNDATALAGAVLLMFVVALMASAIPAFRATRVDPIQMLREE